MQIGERAASVLARFTIAQPRRRTAGVYVSAKNLNEAYPVTIYL